MTLTDGRIEGMAQSLREMAMFPDPIGEVVIGWNQQKWNEHRLKKEYHLE